MEQDISEVSVLHARRHAVELERGPQQVDEPLGVLHGRAAPLAYQQVLLVFGNVGIGKPVQQVGFSHFLECIDRDVEGWQVHSVHC